MITEIGHYALVMSLAVAIVQSILPLVGAHLGNHSWMTTGRTAALAQLLLVGIAFAALTNAYVTSDFSLLNVARNSHSAKPLIYKITGVWANHEGSMLLWVLILALFGAAVAAFGRNLPPTLLARVLAVQAMIGVGFLLFILLTSNPFERLETPPVDGNGMNPLLQDPGIALHPPFLYLGYVGFSIAFCFAIAALIEGKVDAAWARWVRPWTLAAWCFLTAGIALGSWWAYYELGWGGWWFWDPVENASFMPWLAGTALLHSAIVVEKRDALKAWTILLSIIAFSLSLIGTFLVRSGVLTSVHAFAQDPERGVFILILLLIAIGGSFAMYAYRAPAMKAGGLFAPISREGGMVLNNVLLSVATATVLLGTLYPLFLDALGGGKVSVGPPFFNATFLPIMAPMLIALPLGPLLAWKRGDLVGALQRLHLAYAAVVVAVLLVLWWRGVDQLLAALGMGLAAWLVVGSALELVQRIRLFRASLGETWRRARGLPRSAYGMTLAHIGMGIVVAGITGASAWKVEHIQEMRPGDSVNVSGFDFRLDGVVQASGPNYQAERAQFTVSRNGTHIVVLEPEKRFYPVQGRDTTEAGILTTWWTDLYAVIGERSPQGGWVARLYVNPFIAWLWAGSTIMVLGGMLSLSDRRLRVGAPTRRRRRLHADATATG